MLLRIAYWLTYTSHLTRKNDGSEVGQGLDGLKTDD